MVPTASITVAKTTLAARLLQLAAALYAFLVSIGLLGRAFSMFGGGLVDDLLRGSEHPIMGLFEGILATTLVQSSSTTTSVVVALVGSGSISIAGSIYVVMGANIGTSVTNTLVSLGHLSRAAELKRAFAASTIHDFFNVFAVLLLFPLQVATNFLGHAASALARAFEGVGGLTFASPLKVVSDPAVNAVAELFAHRPWLLAVVALVILFAALRALVVTLKSLVLGRVEGFFDEVVFASPGRAMALGVALTILVQSSSITTSLIVPLAGAGLLTLRQIFPYTLGANVGTTVTAILAALAVGSVEAVTVAFAHLLFNLLGIAVIWPLPRIRQLPMVAAERLAGVAVRQPWLAVAYILVCFYIVPFAAIAALR